MNVPSVTVGAWVRIIVLVIALVNGVLLMLGLPILPVGEDDINNVLDLAYPLISALFVIFASLAAWWKNNNFTKKARLKDAEHQRIARELEERERIRNL